MTKRRKASDFPQEVLALFDGYVHGHIQRRDFLEGSRQGAGWRSGCGGGPRGTSSQLRVGSAGGDRRRPDPAGVRHLPFARRLGDHARLHGRARRRDGARARGPRHPRETRPEPLHRRRGPQVRRRGFRGAGAGCAHPPGRLSRQRRRRPGDAAAARQGRDDGGLGGRVPVPAGPRRNHRASRGRRLLLRRRCGKISSRSGFRTWAPVCRSTDRRRPRRTCPRSRRP